MRWVLLLRAVNLGPTNKLAMKDLKAVLEDLGHEDVKTYLNSGNATFTSPERSPKKLARAVEDALRARLDLAVRCCVVAEDDLRAILDAVPELPGYVTVTVLFEPPAAADLEAFLTADWSPDVVRGDRTALFIGYESAHRSKLTNARIEKALGVGATARTPATLRRLVSAG